jgi:hypothetical protein
VKQRRAAAPYAKALFALAQERNQTELVGRELGDVAATFESDLDLRDFFARPWIPATAKRTVTRWRSRSDRASRSLPATSWPLWRRAAVPTI